MLDFIKLDKNKGEFAFNFLKNGFPSYELKSEKQFINLVSRELYHIYCLADGDIIIGMMVLFKLANQALFLEYLLIDKSFRNQGIGKKMIDKLIEIGHKENILCILLETDIPTSDSDLIAISRNRFYEQKGFKKIDSPYFLSCEMPVFKYPLSLWIYLFVDELNSEHLQDIIKNIIPIIHSDYPHVFEVMNSYINFLPNVKKIGGTDE